MNHIEARIAAELDILLPEYKKGPITDIRLLSGGYSNQNYHFRLNGSRFVIRLPGLPQAHHDRRFEQALRAVLPGSLTPQALAEDVIRGVLITAYVDAPLLVDGRPTLSQLVSLFRLLTSALGQVPATTTGRTYDPFAMSRDYLTGCEIPVALAAVLQQCWHPPHLALCHNDLNPWNVLVTSASDFTVLDWEMAGQNDPVFDMVTLVEGLQRDAAVVSYLYQQVVGEVLDPDRLKGCRVAFWLREYAWAAGQLRAGNTRDGISAQSATAYLRLQALI